MKEGLIIFIHGISGDDSTWYKDDKYFKDLLLENEDIKKQYDCVHFNYESGYFYMSSWRNAKNALKTMALKIGLDLKTKNDLTIEDIADILKTDLEYKYCDYSEILIIAHSMGGLIGKKYILENLEKHKVKLFFSLATPYQGSNKAYFIPCSSGFSQNLKPVSDAVMDISKKWIETENIWLPKTFYILGKNDFLVSKNNGYSFESILRNNGSDYKLIPTEDDHSTISKVDSNSRVFLAIKKEILEHIKKKKVTEEEVLFNSEDYNAMQFVVKMITAKVLKSTVDSSKLSYFHFEIIYRKLSKPEQIKLKLLSDKIKQLYFTKYTKFELNQILSSTELILEIKNELQEKDQDYYTFENKMLEHLHKFGLLHSLADREEDIIWDKEVK